MVCLDECSVGYEKTCAFFSGWIECSIFVNQLLLVDCVVVFYIFAYFCLKILSNPSSGVYQDCQCLFCIYLSHFAALLIFDFSILKLCSFACRHSGLFCFPAGLIIMQYLYLSSVIFIALKSALSDNKYSNSFFKKLMFAWYIYFSILLL